MTLPSNLRLAALLTLQRQAWVIPLAIIAMVIAAWLHFYVHDRALDETKQVRSNLEQIENSRRGSMPLIEDSQDARYKTFLASLIDVKSIPSLVADINLAAVDSGLSVKGVDYDLNESKDGGFFIYRVTLPVKARFPEIRRFIFAVLEKYPSASVSNIEMRRDSPAVDLIDSKIELAIFCKSGHEAIKQK